MGAWKGRELTILIPKDPHPEAGSAEQRVHRAMRWLWYNGLYPSPTAVNLRMYGRRSRNLNGRNTKARRDFFQLKGIPLQRG